MRIQSAPAPEIAPPPRPPAHSGPIPGSYEEVKAKVDTVEGWLLDGQEKFLFDMVKSLPDGSAILEMGANFGRSTCAMAFACLGTRKHIYSIDTFCGNDGVMGKSRDFYEDWRSNLRRFGLDGYATGLRGYTFDVLKDRSRFPAPAFVFIDASHEYFDVLQDFKDIYDYVPEGGWIAFHDVEVNWPGPWRLWHDFAPYLLTDHRQVATLACGRKSVSKPFGRGPGRAPGFSFAEACIREFEARYTPSSPLCSALRTSFEGRMSTQAERDAISQAEVRIAEAPERDFRSALSDMMVVKDGGMDGHIRLWYALTLIAEGKVEPAFANLREAALVSYPVPRSRTEPYLRLIRAEAKGDYPPGDAPRDPRFEAFREFTRPEDVVIAYGSGDGSLLRAVEGSRKFGIEADREARKEAIVRHGIDGVEDLRELSDGCADVLLCSGGLERAENPVALLSALRTKLKKGGKAVFRVATPGADPQGALYSWTAATLANLFRAAGFRALGDGPRSAPEGLTIIAEPA